MSKKPQRKSKSNFRPSLELLEDRLCPSTLPWITLSSVVLPGHLVELTGSVAVVGGPGAGATVTFDGAVSDSTTTDANGFFDFTTGDASLGTVTAAGDGATASATIATAAPTITLSITGSTATSVTVAGAVTGIDAPGATVEISGIAGTTVTADSAGSYSTTLTTAAGGAIYADNTDSWGQAATEANANRVVVTLTQPDDQTNYDGDTVTGLPITASDSAGNSLTFTAFGLPSGLGMAEDSNGNPIISGSIAGNADSPTPYSVTVTATDSTAGVSASQTFNWTVNNPVSLTTPADQTNYDGDTVTGLPITASDAEGNTLSYSATGLPSGLSEDPNSGVISGTIAGNADSPTPYSVKVTATDNTAGASASQTFNWTVNNPVSLTTPADQTNYDGDTVTGLAITASDAEGNTLSYSATGLPSGLSEDPNSGIISGTIAGNADSPTPYSVKVTATDNTAGASASQTFNWTVNNPVSLTSPADQTNYDGDTVTGLPITASDAEGNTLSYSATGLPSGLSEDPNSGVISGTIAGNADSPTPYSVKIIATDSTAGASASKTFNWTVNNPVSLTSPADQTNYDGDAVTGLAITASDAEGNTLTYSATGLPSGLAMAEDSNGNPVISGTIAGNADSTTPYSVTITATDSTAGASASKIFNWTINNPVSLTGPGCQTDYDGDAVSLPLTASDAKNNTLSFTVAGLPSGLGLTIDSNGNPVISGIIIGNADLNSLYNATIRATDNVANASFQRRITLRVGTVGLDIEGNGLAGRGTAVAGAPFSLTVTALKAGLVDTDTNYVGTVSFTTTALEDTFVLPDDYTFVAADHGVHTFTNGFSLAKAGQQEIDVSDGNNKRAILITVAPAAVSKFSVVSSPVAVQTATPFSLTVTALDAFGNTVPTYMGTVHFTSNDAAAGVSLPADYTFTVNDAGTHVFSATLVTLNECATITATDTVNAMITTPQLLCIFVRGEAVGFNVAVESGPLYPNETFTVTMTALDVNGNAAAGYTGDVTITKDTYSVDDNFPTTVSFSALNMGTITIDVVFGVQGSLTYYDPLNDAINGNTGVIYLTY